jgi:hypothetical protein
VLDSLPVWAGYENVVIKPRAWTADDQSAPGRRSGAQLAAQISWQDSGVMLLYTSRNRGQNDVTTADRRVVSQYRGLRARIRPGEDERPPRCSHGEDYRGGGSLSKAVPGRRAPPLSCWKDSCIVWVALKEVKLLASAGTPIITRNCGKSWCWQDDARALWRDAGLRA